VHVQSLGEWKPPRKVAPVSEASPADSMTVQSSVSAALQEALCAGPQPVHAQYALQDTG
jgi:hypothetical protein